MDTVGAEWLSLYGYPRPTSPRLEAFARSGVVFEHVYATASWTLPSHATMFTGHYGSELTADWMVPLDRRFPTLAERLTSLGYVTGGFPANQAFGDPVFGLARGFLHYETYPDSWEEVLQNFAIGVRLSRSYQVRRLVGYWNILNRKNAARVNQEFLRWSRHAGRRPFFAFLNYFDTHEPYYPPAPFDSLFGKGLDVLPPGTRIESRDVRVPLKVYRGLPSRTVRQLREAYDGCLAYMDEQIGRLLEELERRGLLDNTIVIVTADHGEMRGEAERFGHGFDVHAPVLHVPLIVRYPPRVPPGLRVDGAVSLRDLAATIADLSGLGSRLRLPGSSLLPADDASPLEADGSPVVSSLDHTTDGSPGLRSIILGREHYIQYRDGREMLFDLAVDRMEVRDLLASGGAQPRAAQLRALLVDAWARSGSPPWSIPQAK
jgi:arylsulfatase A-like enzyme